MENLANVFSKKIEGNFMKFLGEKNNFYQEEDFQKNYSNNEKEELGQLLHFLQQKMLLKV